MLLIFCMVATLLYSDVYGLEPAAISDAPKNVTKTYSSSSAAKEDAIFTCSFVGDPKPEIIWYFLSSSLSSGSEHVISLSGNTSTLTVVNASVADIGLYTCNATNNQRTVTADAYLSVRVFTKITSHPASKVVNEGEESLVLSCDADGFPAPTFEWKKNGTALANSSKTRYSIDGKNLTLTSLNRNDAGNYTCASTNVVSNAVSNAASLTVHYVDPPRFNTSSVMKINETESFFVECTSTSNPKATYSWVNSSGSVVSSSSVLSFNSIQRRDSGTYTCIANNGAGKSDSKNVTLDVYYLDPPKFNTSSVIKLNETRTMFVECTSTSNPKATYNWVNSSGSVVSSSSVLSFNSIQRRDSGTYTCIANNGEGKSDSKSVTLDVYYLDPPKFNTSSELKLNETQTFFVECTSTSNPKATYNWVNSSGSVVSSSSVLSFNSIQRRDSGTYTCIANNGAGKSDSKNVTLDVYYVDPPKLNTSSIMKINETESFFVECTSTSNPKATYSWVNSSGSVVSSSSVLSFNFIQRRDSGTYTCIATNGAGKSDSKNVSLDVYYVDPPRLNTSSIMKINETESFFVECTSTSNPKATYSWVNSSGSLVSSSSVLSFNFIQRRDSGTYTCIATNGAGKSDSKNVTLDVYYLDQLTFNTSTSIILIENALLSVKCLVVSNPKSTFNWRDSAGKVVSNSDTLWIRSVNRSDSGVYSCFANNGAGKLVSKNLTLDVQYIDTPTLNETRSQIILNETSQYYAMCTVTAHPAAEFRWIDSSGNEVSNSPVFGFSSVSRSDSKTYRCRVFNNAGSKMSKNLTVKVNYMDKPTFNGSSSVRLTEATSLFVRCSAVSEPPAQYHWISSTGVTVSNSADLVFIKIGRNSSGNYSCVAVNPFGKKVSSTLSVDVQYIDQAKLNASSKVVVIENSPLYVLCSINSNPPARYQWRIRNGPVVSNSTMLSFAQIHRNNSNTYICNAENIVSQSSVELTVEVQSIDSPVFNTTYETKLVEGQSLYVECYTIAYPITHFQWRTYSGVLVSNSSILSFEPANRKDSKVYRCHGSNPAGTKISSNLTIDVQYIDRPTINSTEIVNLKENSTLRVQCSADSNPTANIQWEANGRVVFNSALLNFNTIKRQNASTYVCNAGNTVGSKKSASLNINVQYLDAPVVESSFSFRNASKSSVNCSVAAYPNPTIEWFKDGTKIRSGYQLNWNPIMATDAGRYVCRVNNVIGAKEKSTEIIVTYPPIISVSSTKTLPNVTINDKLILSCIVDSVPISNVSWMKDGVTLVSRITNALLTYHLQPSRHDTGNYSCVARNSEGTAVVTRNLVVQERPDAPQNLTASNVASRWIQLSWQGSPFDGNSRLLHYEVKYGTDANDLKENVKTSNLKANLTNLSPFTNYYFSLTAVNKLGASQAILLPQKTDSEAPPLPKDAISSPAPSLETASIRIKKFDNTNGIISFYHVIVLKVTSGSSANQDTDSFTGLKAYAVTPAGTPYITAEFSSDVFQQSDEWDFTIGNGVFTSKNRTKARYRRAVEQGYYNVKLEPGSNYKAFYRAYINDQKFSSTRWIDFKTKTEDTGLTPGAIAGIVIVCILLPIILVALFIYRRRRDKDKENNDEDEAPRKPHRLSVFKRSFQKVRLDPREAVSRASFEIHVNTLSSNSGYGFSQEYLMIDKSYRHSHNHSSSPINVIKNRYANIHAYDHSRVVLQGDGTPGSDYINANHIRGFNSDSEYIAAQGPLPETITDFWTMIWEQQCPAIVMLTSVQEKGRQKCAQYWPTQGSATFKDLVVNVLEVLEYPDLIITTFHLSKVGHSLERTVKHFYYISWPDFGVPSEPSALFSLIKKVNRWRRMALEKGPLTVHCSAGVGRTGTYITIDTQLNRLSNGRDITIFSNVCDLREQRYLMVQTEDQYAYIHNAVLEYIRSGDTEIEAHELRDYIKRKSEVDSRTGSTGMMDEFVALARDEARHSFHEASKMHNQSKNRYKNVYPYDTTRVLLSQIQGLTGSDYINASHVNGYSQPGAFIATQAPLQRTFEDFWRMIWEKDSRTIVMLSKEQEGGKVKVNQYWPNEGSIKSGILIIELVNNEEHTEYILRTFKITNSEGQSRVVRHYQYTSWPENSPPESAFGIIDLIGQVSKWNMTVENKKITVHCSAGVGRTGVFIALTNLIEQLKTEAMVDVYQTVKRLRQQRTAMVQTRDQYEFCYRALQEYLDSFDHYANFE